MLLCQQFIYIERDACIFTADIAVFLTQYPNKCQHKNLRCIDEVEKMFYIYFIKSLKTNMNHHVLVCFICMNRKFLI